MARGQQKIQSQQKNAEKQAKLKKAKGHDQKTAAKAALKITCGVSQALYSIILISQIKGRAVKTSEKTNFYSNLLISLISGLEAQKAFLETCVF